MTRRSRREVERQLDRIESEAAQSAPELLIYLSPVDEDVAAVVHADLCVRGAGGEGYAVVTADDIAEVRSRLEAALDELADRERLVLDPDAVIEYFAGRWRGDIEAGEAGVREYFGTATPDHLNEVWAEMVRATDSAAAGGSA